MFAATRSLAALIVFAFCTSTVQAEWGHLTGKFIYDGPVPQTRYVSRGGKDQAVCGEKILDESLLVDKKTGGVANVVVYLRTKDAKIHPDYKSTAKAEVRVAMEKCRFEPHIVLLRVGQDMVLMNKDPIGHNPGIIPPGENGFGPLFSPKQSIPFSYRLSWHLPQPIVCNIHPWMKGYVLCRDNPYMAVTKLDGSFEIKQIPAGEHEFQFWHETTNFLVAKPGWDKGRAKFTIKAGETTDLGEIKLDPKLFSESEK